MRTTHKEDDLRLREKLRRGDPAQGDRSLDSKDLALMRREMLGNAEARGPFAPVVTWRRVAVVACVITVVAMGWQLRIQSVRRPAVPRPEATEASSPRDGAIPREVDLPRVVEAEPAPVVPALAGESEPVPPVEVAASDPEQARTLRFTTRRGTQIIWILDPELEL